MVTQQLPFSATEDELELALQILDTWGTNGVLKGEHAKDVFNRSALPHVTLRLIWSMSDGDASGDLSRDELAKALRLIGWVQTGERLHEGLLASVGPLPTLDGITTVKYKSQRKSHMPQISLSSAVNEPYVQEFKTIFFNAGPDNGFLTEEKALNVYMTAADLSYEDIRSIINVVAQTSQYGLNFTEFACGLYFVRALQSSQLHSVPKSIPQYLLEQFKDSPKSLATTPTSPKATLTGPRPQSGVSPKPSLMNAQNSHTAKLIARAVSPSPSRSQTGSSSSYHSADDDWSITPHDRSLFDQYFRKIDEKCKGYIEKEEFEVFVSVYRVPAADLSRIWVLSNMQKDGRLKRDEFMIAMHLVKQRSAGEEIPATLPESILPPSLRSRSMSLSQKIATKKQPPPLPPKRRASILKGVRSTPNATAHLSMPPVNPLRSIPLSPPLSPPSEKQLHQPPIISVSNPPSPAQADTITSPFEDPVEHPGFVNGICPPPPPPPPSRPPLSPPAPSLPADNPETLDKFRNEISRLSEQVDSLLRQLATHNNLRDANDALRLENEILKTQVKDTEKMMTDILTANETESAGSQERHAQDITRVIGDLAEKEAQCEERDRKIAVMTEDEQRLREKLRKLEGTVAEHVAEAAEHQQVIESQKKQIAELNDRVADMNKALADEPEEGPGGNNRQLRVVIRDVTRENDDLKGQNRDMQRSMEQMLLSTKHGRYDEMEGENKQLRKQLSELEVMVTQMQTSASGSLGSSTIRRSNGQTPLGQRSARPSLSLRGQNPEGLLKENDQLKSQLQDGKRTFADYRSQSETKIVDFQQKIDALMQENNRLKLDIHESMESRRLDEADSQEDSSVPPPAYDGFYVAS